jgi:hypothetical protein
MELFLKYFGMSMTCLLVISYGWRLVEEWRTPRKEEEEIELPDGRKVKVKISPPLDFDYPWNRGRHWFFRSPYRDMSPFAFFMVIAAVSINYGWAGVGGIWIFVLILGGIGIIISLFESR